MHVHPLDIEAADLNPRGIRAADGGRPVKFNLWNVPGDGRQQDVGHVLDAEDGAIIERAGACG